MGIGPESRSRDNEDERKPNRSPRYYARGSRSQQEAMAIEEAYEVEGLSDEIAMLRARLRDAANAEKVDLSMVLRGLEVLTKAVATQYRLSPRARKDLAANLAVILNRFGDLIVPADR